MRRTHVTRNKQQTDWLLTKTFIINEIIHDSTEKCNRKTEEENLDILIGIKNLEERCLIEENKTARSLLRS